MEKVITLEEALKRIEELEGRSTMLSGWQFTTILLPVMKAE